MSCPNPSFSMRYERAKWRRDCDCPDCSTRRAEYIATRDAARWGYDVDEVTVDWVVRDRVAGISLNRAERAEAARRLTQAGVSSREIARILGTSQRTIIRYRGELRDAA